MILLGLGVVACAPAATTPAPPAACSVTSGRARLAVVHEDRVVQSLRLTRARYAIDGRIVAERATSETPDGVASRFTAFDADVATGTHVISLELRYATRFPTPYGYDYAFVVRSAHATCSGAGGDVVTATSLERGSITTPIEDRLAVEWSAP